MTGVRAWRPTRAMLTGAGGWAVLAAIVVLAVWLVARAPDDGRPHHRPGARAEVGRVYGLTTSSNPHDPAGSVLVRVPTGAARITVYTRTDEAYRMDGSADASVQAPSGGQLFTVATAGQALDRSTVAVAGQSAPDSQLALVLDGRRYPLDPTTGAARSFAGIPGDPALAVGVHGNPTDVGVAVTFEGVTQTFDLTRHTHELGRATPLYSTPAIHPRACGAVEAGAGYTAAPGAEPAQCLVQLRTVPWVPGSGWAPAGQAWPLVSLVVTPPTLVRTPSGGSFRPDTSRYDTNLMVRVADHEAVEAGSSNALAVEASGIRLFVGRTPVTPSRSVPVVIYESWRLDAITDSADRPAADELLRWTTTLS